MKVLMNILFGVIFVAILFAFVWWVALPDFEMRQSYNALVEKVDIQQKQLDKFEKANSSEPAKLDALEARIDDLSKQLEEKEPKSTFEEETFAVGTLVAGLTFIVAVVTLAAALIPLLEIEAKTRKIVKSQIDQLDTVMSGRLQVVMGIIFRKITWAKGYKVVSKTHDFGEEAISAAQTALNYYEKVEGKENDERKSAALNNLVFYTTLARMSRTQDRKVVKEVLALAEQLKKDKNFSKTPNYINTYCLTGVTFYESVGTGSKETVIKHLKSVEDLLIKNRDTEGGDYEKVRDETCDLLKKCRELITSVKKQ